MANEGVLGRMRFGGERAHTGDHPPIFRSGIPADPATPIKVGTLVYLDDNGKVAAWKLADANPAGVVDLPFDPEINDTVFYLAHGTVKAALLMDGDEAELDAAAITALEAAGIYPV